MNAEQLMVRKLLEASGIKSPDKPCIPSDIDLEKIQKTLCDLGGNTLLIAQSKENLELLSTVVHYLCRVMFLVYDMANIYGVDIEPCFKAIFESNLRMLFPDGKFHKDENGNLLVPEGWKKSDIDGILKSMGYDKMDAYLQKFSKDN